MSPTVFIPYHYLPIPWCETSVPAHGGKSVKPLHPGVGKKLNTDQCLQLSETLTGLEITA